MAIKTKDEILNSIKTKLGDDTTDEAIALIEDITDTITELENKTKDNTDYKKKCEDLDAAWRKKYRDRFYSAGNEVETVEENGEEDKPLTYENLFKEGEK